MERKEDFKRRKDNTAISENSPSFHTLAPGAIPQWEGNSTLTEDDTQQDKTLLLDLLKKVQVVDKWVHDFDPDYFVDDRGGEEELTPVRSPSPLGTIVPQNCK